MMATLFFSVQNLVQIRLCFCTNGRNITKKWWVKSLKMYLDPFTISSMHSENMRKSLDMLSNYQNFTPSKFSGTAE